MKYLITFSLVALASLAFCQEQNQPKDSTKTESISLLPTQPINFNVPLYFVDNKEISAADMQKIDPNQITMINVLKDSTATAKYGARGRNGVVVLHLRDNSKPAMNKKRSPNK